MSTINDTRIRIEHGNISSISNQRLLWVDWLKGMALIWIFINHATEAVFGGPYLGNPFSGWPPLQERITQWIPLGGYGIWAIPVNVWRYVGWLGDQGVNLFLIVSGFGLTWGLWSYYRDKSPFPFVQFYQRRLLRIFPLWWGTHILFVAVTYLTGFKRLGMTLDNPNFYWSLAGIRFLPDTFSYFAPAWWYIGLIIQLYLVYPILWAGLKRLGPFQFLVLSCLVAFIARGIGLAFLSNYIAPWQYGAIFITRLPEFAFGMSFAIWLRSNPQQVNARIFTSRTVWAALLLYVLGTLLSLTWWGMVIAPFVVGLGAFTVFYGLLGNKSHNSSLVAKGFTWIGKHSYSLYLIHHPVIALLVPRRALVGILLSVIVTVIGAIFLEALINGVLNILSSWHKKYGLVATGVRITLVGLAVFICAIGIELAVQQVNPQEAEGWGERPSLEPHAVFGWRLKPNQTTRLRWESYDYYVIANELGFPGPAYPEHKTSDTIRILTFGDAFTSAEGVNTEQAWSRLLEKNLASRLPSHKIEVMNFAITGYGPNQYTAVAETFVPKYQPDLIIIGFFANDYTDVSMSNDDFHSGIGFGLPSGHGWYTTIRLLHTRILLAHELQRLANTIRSKPDLGKYSGAAMLQQQQLDYEITGRQKVADRLKQIKTIADKVGAQMMIAMIPMPVQVCGPDEITYYPSGFDLTDPAQFDLDKPQRLTQKIAGNLELEYFDLRSPLQAMEECPYQPRNLHWTAAGHQAVADYMANVLLADSHYLSSLNKELNK